MRNLMPLADSTLPRDGFMPKVASLTGPRGRSQAFQDVYWPMVAHWPKQGLVVTSRASSGSTDDLGFPMSSRSHHGPGKCTISLPACLSMREAAMPAGPAQRAQRRHVPYAGSA